MRTFGRARYCEVRAAQIGKRAHQTTNSSSKTLLRKIAKQWRLLAQRYRVADCVSRLNSEMRKLVPGRTGRSVSGSGSRRVNGTALAFQTRKRQAAGGPAARDR
jgi:hypothetical protein